MALTIQNLFVTMIEERKKTRSDEDEDFVVVPQENSQWPKLFNIYFLSSDTRLAQTSTSTTSDDDLIFYVTRKTVTDDEPSASSVEAFRHHDIKRRPKLGAPEYDWEETTNLNLILHQFEYTVTTAICVKTSSKALQIYKRLSTRVYASPSRRDMKDKGIGEKITHPDIYFTVDNFEDAFCEMIVNEEQMVCVELVARNPILERSKVLFLGSIKYEALKKVYENRVTTSARVAQRITLGMYTKRRVEFVRMRGPNSKGHAEMAVSRYQSGSSTPESNPSSPLTSNSDEENWDKRHAVEHNSASRYVPSTASQQSKASNAATPEVESTDIRQELSDDVGGFLGRRFSQAISWVRGSNTRLNETLESLPLQTCLTYITLPCQMIVKDLLESNSIPILTPQ